MSLADFDYRLMLWAELEARCQRNPAYSARAFSRDLGLSAGYVNHVLHNRRTLNEETAFKVAGALGWDEARKKFFITLVRLAGVRDPHARAAILEEAHRLRHSVAGFQPVSQDVFHSIGEWHHYAILELTLIEGYKCDRRGVGERLGLPPDVVDAAVERLVRLGWLEEAPDGRLKKCIGAYTTGDIPSAAIRAFHGTMLEKAKLALRDDNVESRDFSGVTMAVDPERLPAAKVMIRNFRRDLMAFLEGGTPSALYHLSVQLFQLDAQQGTGHAQHGD